MTNDKKEDQSDSSHPLSKEQLDLMNRIDIQYDTVSLLIEELENIGINVEGVKEIILEAKKSLSDGELTNAEYLLKNSQSMAFNFLLEHRMNLVSTTISFIDTFIFDLTGLDIDLESANDCFKKARSAFERKELPPSNEYLEECIEKIKDARKSLQSKKLNDAYRYIKFWLIENENIGLDVINISNLLHKVEDAFNSQHTDKAEKKFQKLLYFLIMEIKKLDLGPDRQENMTQELLGIYGFEDFTLLADVVSQAQNMLLESQNKEKYSLLLNVLLVAYKRILELKRGGVDTPVEDLLFQDARASFKKEKYSILEVQLQKIVDLIDQKELSEKQKMTEKMELLNTELKELKTEVSVEIKILKKLKDKGMNISEVKKKIGDLKGLMDNRELENGRELFDEIKKEVSLLNEQLLREKDEKIKIKTKAKTDIEKLTHEISDAKKDKVDTAPVEDMVDLAENQLKDKNYSEVQNIILEAKELLNKCIQEHSRSETEQSLKDSSEVLIIDKSKVEKDIKKRPGVEREEKRVLETKDEDTEQKTKVIMGKFESADRKIVQETKPPSFKKLRNEELIKKAFGFQNDDNNLIERSDAKESIGSKDQYQYETKPTAMHEVTNSSTNAEATYNGSLQQSMTITPEEEGRRLDDKYVSFVGLDRGRRSPGQDAIPQKIELEQKEINNHSKLSDHDRYEKRMTTLKKEALIDLQEIQRIISESYHFGIPVDELERLSEDSRNAFDAGDYQEVLQYVDKIEDISRQLKVGYMDNLIVNLRTAGENTKYLEYLLHEIEEAYYNERYKIGDEIARRFMTITNDLDNENKKLNHSWVFCRFCGTTIPQDSSFCSYCGKKLL